MFPSMFCLHKGFSLFFRCNKAIWTSSVLFISFYLYLTVWFIRLSSVFLEFACLWKEIDQQGEVGAECQSGCIYCFSFSSCRLASAIR